MADTMYDELLKRLLEYARNVVEGPRGPITAERFLVALIDVINGTFKIDDKESFAEAENYLRNSCTDLNAMKRQLSVYILDIGDSSLGDHVYMKKKMDLAADMASKEGVSVTSDLLLKCILGDPSVAISSILSILGTSSSEGEKNEEVAVNRNVGGNDPVGKDSNTPRQRIEELTETVKKMHDELSSIVLGQENAISVFTSGYFRGELIAMTDKTRQKPKATYLFAGPPGVGKTLLAETVAKKCLKLPFMRFDMSEYCEKEAANEFIGTDEVYKGSKRGNFTGFVADNPKCVVLFDEIEKAHISIIHLFLQILDAGRIRDSHSDEEISLKDAILIFTTNAGKQLYAESDTGDFSTVSRKVILKALEKDTSPTTGQPYFPAAICSRFASGNVVMFNHMGAHTLCDIAKNAVLRQSDNFEKEFCIKTKFDDRVFSALLYAEGGAADARTVSSRAGAFFDDEIYELFRLMGKSGVNTDISDIDSINFNVELPTDKPEITALFEERENPEILLFSSDSVAQRCREKTSACEFIHAKTFEEAKARLSEYDIKVVLVDISYGRKSGAAKYLNIEDVESAARDLFMHIRMTTPDLPLYLIQTNGNAIDPEERVSMLRQGVRGILSLSGRKNTFKKDIDSICKHLYQQQVMKDLARSNKVVRFQTAQSLSKGGKTAQIKLFDFVLEMAVDSEDSKNILSGVSKPDVKFDRIYGAEDAKRELADFIEYLKRPKAYVKSGAKPPKGVLLYGPPGTGKTFLAKAMAGESDVTFMAAEGNQFLKKYVGEGPEKVHELFATARKYAPTILFVDEIDAIGRERDGEGSDGVEATLTAFLAEMDGFKQDPSKPVFVLAATNFNIEPGTPKSLDPALVRRFDRKILVDLPNREAREKYMRDKIAANPIYAISDEKIANIAIRSTGMSLALLEQVFDLALRNLSHTDETAVTDAIFDEAFEIYNNGEKKEWSVSELERTARHEAGHALLCWLSGETPSYLTIVARADHGGYMRHGDNENKGVYTKSELIDHIRTALGGRAAEIVYYGEKDGISTGASGDLAQATSVAKGIVCSYGMDDRFGLAVIDSRAANYGDLSAQVRDAVNKILAEEMNNAIRLISENRKAIDSIVEVLLIENHLGGDAINSIFEKAVSDKK